MTGEKKCLPLCNVYLCTEKLLESMRTYGQLVSIFKKKILLSESGKQNSSPWKIICPAVTLILLSCTLMTKVKCVMPVQIKNIINLCSLVYSWEKPNVRCLSRQRASLIFALLYTHEYSKMCDVCPDKEYHLCFKSRKSLTNSDVLESASMYFSHQNGHT